jgi:hypothetical protein
MRLVVTGGRNFTDKLFVEGVLQVFHLNRHIDLLIAGGAPGVDTLCQKWAEAEGIPTKVMMAEWDLWGKQAGRIRNEAMILQGKPDYGLVFPGGKGTHHMMSMLKLHNVPFETVA